jgi:ribosomal protein S18 acetylase RimI-like enzyme
VPEVSAGNPTVRRVRGDEGRALREIRLAALKDTPAAFGSTYESEAARTDADWSERAELGASGVERVTFFALVDDQIVGLVGGYRPDTGEPTVELVSMWTAPTARRIGVASALVMAVLDWARGNSATTVHLWVTHGNEPALRLYESMGFRRTGESQSLPSDPTRLELAMAQEL